MKRKLTNEQMQDSIAELTDDVVELKEAMQEVKENQVSAERQFNLIFEVLDRTANTIDQIARSQLRYEKQANARMAQADKRMAQADERLTRLETTVQKLSDTVDRYFSARLNGGSKN